MNKALKSVDDPVLANSDPALPTTFAAWKAAGGKFFENGDSPTLTRVIDVMVSGVLEPKLRRAFGLCKTDYLFDFQMDAADVTELCALWADWVRDYGGATTDGGPHTFMIDVGGQGPPACGPPNGPPC